MKAIGYTALIETYRLEVLTPPVASYLSPRSERRTRLEGGRRLEYYSPRYDPGGEWTGHLVFALKHEGVNLEVLAALFHGISQDDLTTFIRSTPTGRYARVIWFLYEWLTGRVLSLPDLTLGNYVPVLDPERYFALPRQAGAVSVRRQRVVNNLPGTPEYCPLVRRTEALEAGIAEKLDERARAELRRFPQEIIYRAVSYLYVKETKSSFGIEHLRPDQRRTARFVELLRRAGSVPCFTEADLTALQRLIVDERYAAAKFRDTQNYVGQSVGPGRELVHFVPPRPEDLRRLMEAWASTCLRLQEGDVHPVVIAAVAGFGFVFLHPFEDGNGRLHRFLIHHVLAAGGFTPEGIIFPVSAMMLKEPARYDAILEAFSRQVMQHVEYRLNDDGTLRVLNPTASWYRFPDLTFMAEGLFAFIRDTIEREFTAELEYLAVFDKARRRLGEIVDMPDRRLDLFLRLCIQGQGKLSGSKRGQFRELTDDEILRMEAIVRRALRRETRASPRMKG